MAEQSTGRTAEQPEPAVLGRRERAKIDKRRRLFDAAGDLFARHGYSAVTTQQIADAADVGTGTLFRYFPTKADLLVEVMSDHIRAGIDEALTASKGGADPVTAITALVAPLARAGAEHPENVAAYLRETLFGPENLRAIAVAHGMAMPDAIEDVLRRYAELHPVKDGVDLRDVADALYAMVWFEGIKIITQRGQIQADRIHHIVEFLVRQLVYAD